MKHYGDITKINGAEVPVVDIITGGSPCQDLSVAGKRAGLAGERSGLFMEQMRIVKEMRERERATGRTGWMVRPRYMVWENVPGAFSSNGGKDFQAVLTEIVKIAEPDAPDVPLPDKGKWPKAGCLYGVDRNWSLSYRVHDAQFWGVPQRRKRISLVADFGGLSAPEILFERKGLSGDSEQSGETREGASSTVEGSAGGTGFGETGIGYWQNGIQTLRAEGENRPSRPSNVIVSVHATQDPIVGNDISPCISQGSTNGTAMVAVYDGRGNGDGKTVCTITGDHQNRVTDYTALCVGNGQANQSVLAYGIDQQGGKGGANKSVLAYGISSYDSNSMKSPNPHSGIYEADTARTLDLNDGSPACNQGGIAILCLNDQGGSVMGVSEDVTGALRAEEHGHQPNVWNGKADGASGNGVAFATVGDHENRPTDMTNLVIGTYQTVTGALTPGAHPGSYNGQDAYNDMLIAMASTAAHAEITTDGVSPSLLARAGTGGNNMPNITRGSIVRRLTPLECERLQGYPDGWTDIGEWTDSKGKKHGEADSPRYKALGNSIALPFWQWMARRICAQYERTVTMASLFDGIGGFPLVFQRCGAVPVWASEIEEFPIAVTKARFPDESV